MLTGNIRPLAEVKLGALGLAGQLDLDAGAYGDAHEDRAELVLLARRAAAAAYREDFSRDRPPALPGQHCSMRHLTLA